MKHLVSTAPAQLDLSFVVRNGQTLLDRRLFSYPYVLMRTFREPSATASRLMALVQNSSGPVHDRDDLAINLGLNDATDVRIAWQGATAVHRARSGNVSRERLTLTLGENARLSYLPEARIYFPDARHQQSTDIALSAGSTLLFSDSFTTHDPDGLDRPLAELDNTLTITRDGETVLLDRQHLKSPSFPPGFRAFATLLLIGHAKPEIPALTNLYAAISALPSDLGWSLRLAAPTLQPIRHALAQASACANIADNHPFSA